MSRQFENPANAEIHSRTTAQEILRDFGEVGLDYWVTGFGTGGTLTGVARVLKDRSPKTRVVATEPDNSPLLSTGFVQDFNADGSAAASHPGFRPHLMQGWTPDFISALANEALEKNYIDQFQPVAGDDAMDMAKALARQEGIFCGTSGGATFAAALEVARTAPKGSKILAMLPDTGERYLSTPLFDGVAVEMTDAEMDLSMSTPGSRFDIAATPAAAAPTQAAKREALAYVERAVTSKPVVMFALERCEFCWSVRKMFAEADIEYEAINLDSTEYQKDNLGGDLRAALRDITGVPTIPQIFVGGEHIGGATETFDAFNDGNLQRRLDANGVIFDKGMKANAYSFLPKWLHPR
jgi:cysteine synthase A